MPGHYSLEAISSASHALDTDEGRAVL